MRYLEDTELKIVSKTFLVGILVGVIYGAVKFQNVEQFLGFILPIFEDIIQNNQDLKFLPLMLDILRNNLLAVALTIALGLIHRFLAQAVIMINGILLGVVFYATIFLLHQPAQLWQILPHGVFEIPALLISGALAIKLSSDSKGGTLGRFQVLAKAKHTLLIILVLLIIAAAIESSLIATLV
ncbi:MAG: stage II sporulation protein M [Candidatus Daviesbacteria bacterium]|nr:stage II sporulation protein M [Candidatus Daviesbacteria bacterium]